MDDARATLDAVSHALRGEDQARDAARVDVRLADLTRRFGDIAAIDSVTVDVARGEFSVGGEAGA
jgi:hypothetical protein